jgi:acetylornithine deacetylase/succinyl-diaminopimelate desuccinylase-like protein
LRPIREFKLVALLLAGVACPAKAQDTDTQRLQDEAVSRTQEYLRLNTVNPPGNEIAGAEFFRRIFQAEGIPFEIVESAPGRANIRAWLDGGPEPALVLLHHMDVVPADPRFWETDPLAGERRGDFLYGRGALDTKTLGILHLQAFLDLHRSGRRLRRPVLFIATADEEAGGMFGAGWLVQNRPEWFRNVGLLLNEGGNGTDQGGKHIFEIEVTQKVPLWIRLMARGEPGHGSLPRVSSAVNTLIRGLERLRSHAFTPRIVPAVDNYLKARAAAGIGPFADRLASPAAAVRDAAFMLRLQTENPFLAAITRNTCSITRLEGSSKINVVPPQASAEIDCRLLPDQDPGLFLQELARILDEPDISIEKIMAFSPAVSPTDTEPFRTLERITREYFAAATILPSVQTGFTDSHFFRDLGIASYGYSPLLIPAADAAGVHGNNERIAVANIRRGVVVMRAVVRALSY